MKEKIYTIPVNEAFSKDCECPFCELFKKAEDDALNYTLGPSYMEEDVREITNKQGFCKEHILKMFNLNNRLGVALMMDTHLKQINKDLDEILSAEQNVQKKSLFKKPTQIPLCAYSDKLSSSCFVCSRIDSRMRGYIDTFFYLYKKEPDFKEKVLNGKGFCLNHFSYIIKEAKIRMNDKAFAEFFNALIPLEKEHLKRIEGELDWFIQKFDYLNHDKPWKNSKDALERTILKINSAYTE